MKEWGITKNYLDDLYVRFFRIAERRIAETTGKGVMCFISNFSYVTDPSFVVMREGFLRSFQCIWIDCMNGDSRETGKLTPEGKPDPSVFSTPYNREGIRVGTAICLAARRDPRGNPRVLFRHFWGVNKNADLLASLRVARIDGEYVKATADVKNRYSFRPMRVRREYEKWPGIAELCATAPMLGLNENRSGALQDIEREKLVDRIQKYYDSQTGWKEIVAMGTGLSAPAAGFHPVEVRQKVLSEEEFSPNRVVRYVRRPYDIVWAYVSDVSPLWNRSRPELRRRFVRSSYAVITRPTSAASPEGVPFLATTFWGEQDLIRGHAYYFPIFLVPEGKNVKKGQEHQLELQATSLEQKPTTNLSADVRAYLAKLGIKNVETNVQRASVIWMHALAIGYSPAYLKENADGIRQDWPRIPLPKSAEMLERSAALGRKIASLLDTE
ncbi:MAG: DNA methyltransferase, partial [Deltaproteobacteria bacterium]|nr:DNA methyltransferase [Deltaproteobacteria bacterium]